MSEYPPGGMSTAPPNSSMAIISLIAGILGLTFFPLLGSLVAVITGPMAKKEIRESMGALGGEGLATAGMVLGWIGIGLSVVGLCVVGAVFAIPACAVLFGLSTESWNMILPSLLVAF